MDLIFVPRYMAELTKEEEESNKVKEDWKFVAMVLDRSFVIVIIITIIAFVIVINITIIIVVIATHHHYRHHHHDCQHYRFVHIFLSKSSLFSLLQLSRASPSPTPSLSSLSALSNDAHDSNLCRLFLWIFSIAVVVGTAGIILQVKYCDLFFSVGEIRKKYLFCPKTQLL